MDKLRSADVVFRGTIVELRDTDVDHSDPSLRKLGLREFNDTKKIAVFRVARVWKGDVGITFEMPAVEETSACIGFWPDLLHVGADLIVYARKRDAYYFTGICGGHKPAKVSNDKDAKDLRQLGPGREPSRSGAPRSSTTGTSFESFRSRFVTQLDVATGNVSKSATPG